MAICSIIACFTHFQDPLDFHKIEIIAEFMIESVSVDGTMVQLVESRVLSSL